MSALDLVEAERAVRFVALSGMWGESGICKWCGCAAAANPGEKANHLPECAGIEAVRAAESLVAEVRRLRERLAMASTFTAGWIQIQCGGRESTWTITDYSNEHLNNPPPRGPFATVDEAFTALAAWKVSL